MNYSNAFRQGANCFLGINRLLSSPTTYSISSIDNSKVFVYLITRYGLKPVVGNNTTASQYVMPIYREIRPSQSETTVEINKAESIILRPTSMITTYKLENSFFYASLGLLFDQDKNPIILVCKRDDVDSTVICLDYSILKHQDTPMNRFIMRKLLPYIIETDKVFMFANCSSFVVHPTFQGELDSTLVKDFLIGKLRTEYTVRHEK